MPWAPANRLVNYQSANANPAGQAQIPFPAPNAGFAWLIERIGLTFFGAGAANPPSIAVYDGIPTDVGELSLFDMATPPVLAYQLPGSNPTGFGGVYMADLPLLGEEILILNQSKFATGQLVLQIIDAYTSGVGGALIVARVQYQLLAQSTTPTPIALGI